MNRSRPAEISLQLLPFCLLCGTFLQGVGLMLFGIILPAIFLGHAKGTKLTTNLASLGKCLLAIFCVFPLANLYNFYFALPDTLLNTKYLSWKYLLESQVSTSLALSALALLALAKRRHKATSQEAVFGRDLNLAFTKGMVIATSILSVYCLIQHFTGFDYREPGLKLPDAKLMESHGYRILGFFGHPLSMAGASLAIFSIYWTLFCLDLQKFFGKNRMRLLFTKPMIKAHFFLSMAHLMLSLLSGGRAAFLIALGLLVLIPSITLRKRLFHFSGRKILYALLPLSMTGAIVWTSGILSRYIDLLQSFQDKGADRFIFWQVHWQMFLDKPWFGHGASLLKAGERIAYYERLGFASLRDKYNAHNLYLEILSNVGLIGAIVIIVALTVFCRRLFTLSSKPLFQKLCIAFFVALFANLANGFTQNTFFDSNVLYIHLGFFWLLLWLA